MKASVLRRKMTVIALMALALALVASCSLGAAGAAVARAPERACPESRAVGTGERAASAVVERFLRTAVVRPPESRAKACVPPALAVPGLVHPTYETRYPRRIGAWFQLAPKIRNDRGLWEYAGFLYVSAPDVRPAAFQFLLELHGRRWLVSSFEVAPGAVEVDAANAPS
jgi:hypothetical protein